MTLSSSLFVGRTFLLPASLLFLALAGVRGADATLRTMPAMGEPGEEVAVEFRATFSDPLVQFQIRFGLPDGVADFVRTETGGTVSAHASPRGVIYNPNSFHGGFIAGAQFNTQTPNGRVDPGQDVPLIKAILRIRPDAVAGEVGLFVAGIEFTKSGGHIVNVKVKVESGAVLTVLTSDRPRPVRDLQCLQSGEDVLISWSNTESNTKPNTEPYDTISVLREDGVIGRLAIGQIDGAATSLRDRPPVGPAAYEVRAFAAGKESLASRCLLTVQPPRAHAMSEFECSSDAGVNRLRWRNGAAYDSIQVVRNSRTIAFLDGGAQSFDDPFRSDLLTIYTLRASAGGLEAPLASCRLNEMSREFVFWAEEVRAEPGDFGVPIRIFGTNPEAAWAFSIGIRVDPTLAKITKLTLDQTACEAANYDQFMYQTHVLGKGETAAAILFNTVPPYGPLYPSGADSHILTVIVNVKSGVPRGSIIPVDVGAFGSPKLLCIFTVEGPRGATTRAATTRNGAILVGTSPVPPVEDLAAEVREVEPALPAGGAEPVGGARDQVVHLSWTNAGAYSSIRIERNALEAAVLSGDATEFIDEDAGAGMPRYRVIPMRDGLEAFPAIATALPRGVPGTFIRGDANSDDRVNLSDPISILDHLFRGGPQPRCLDAADADDSGRLDLSDPISLLQRLFQGAIPLPAPGPRAPWFDPTSDGLGCD